MRFVSAISYWNDWVKRGNGEMEKAKGKRQKSKGKSFIRRGLPTAFLSALLVCSTLWTVADARAQDSPTRNPKLETRNFEPLTPNSESRTPNAQHLVPIVKAVDAVGMTVSDMERSIEFYSKVLSFEKVSDVEVWGTEYEHLQGLFGLRMRVVRMKLGDEAIELTEYLAPKGRPLPVDSRSNDRWFQHVAIIVNDMDRAYQWLRQHKVQHASTGPQRLPDWNPNAGGIQAFYFKDPDGHALEILQFPADKGDPRWHRKSDKMFLGIDHTAIVVADTDASLKFYRDLLGLKIAGTSENYGTEQEHLNNVFGARLRITSLRAAEGPGIEFLEYLAPRDGRLYPEDARANDILHWQTKLVTHNTEAMTKRGGSGEYQLLSPGAVTISSKHLGFRKAITIRDPDGHVMQIIEK
jgi:catechol 2,3-dioxygenase-like lactoylglutathione lyase family enzyme